MENNCHNCCPEPECTWEKKKVACNNDGNANYIDDQAQREEAAVKSQKRPNYHSHNFLNLIYKLVATPQHFKCLASFFVNVYRNRILMRCLRNIT